MSTRNIERQHGFTIIEFMVATTVFSVILLSVSAAVLQMNRMYQRSINQSRTQAVTSNLIDTVAQAVRFSTGQVITFEQGTAQDRSYSLCVGNRQFIYTLGRRINDDQPYSVEGTTTKQAVMTRAKPADCSTYERIRDSTPTGSPKELLAYNMRLSNLEVVSTGNMFRITARVVYGDDDLLCDPSIDNGNSCTVDTTYLTTDQIKASRQLQCKPTIGSEFCAMSELSSTVYRRL